MMKIPIITRIFNFFLIFYAYAGIRLVYICVLVFLSGLSDGFGLSMLIPLLYIDKSTEPDAYTQLIRKLIESTGLPFSLYSILLFLIIAFILKAIFLFVQKVIHGKVITNLRKEVLISMLQKYSDMNYTYFYNKDIGYLNNLSTIEVTRFIWGFSRYVDLLVKITNIFLYVGIAFVLNWVLTLIVILICCTFFVIFRVLSRMISRFSRHISMLNASLQEMFIQYFYYFKYLKSTSNFYQINSQIKNIIIKYQKVDMKTIIATAIPNFTLEPIAIILISSIILFQTEVLESSISECIVLIVFFYRTFTCVSSFQNVWHQFCSYLGSVEVIENAIKELDVNKESNGKILINNFKHQMELKNVNVWYDTKQALFDINMIIQKNKSIGIVGESGAGKTTLFDIITGLIRPDTGIVKIDDVDCRNLNYLELRHMMGYVTQEPVIFNDTIANNICFWECDIKDNNCLKRIEKAAKLANCTDFIQETKDGYNTIVGDKGVRLSGGQRQRLAIAREIFKEPQILIFDEATSSLDTESERSIKESINNMKGDRTIIIIAHRLSTIKDCDFIYVIHKGRVIEEGTYNDLYAKENSNFRKMCNNQILSY